MTDDTTDIQPTAEEEPFDLEKYRSIGAITGRSRGSWDQVREFRSEESGVVRKTKDELGNVVTEHSKTDRQDVHINANTVTAAFGSTL